ncbi:MAG: LptF/LptG family permease [Planctomycetes bacterium]|nr:LptF/LptG family permease [Planctomycetota bacterium]
MPERVQRAAQSEHAGEWRVAALCRAHLNRPEVCRGFPFQRFVAPQTDGPAVIEVRQVFRCGSCALSTPTTVRELLGDTEDVAEYWRATDAYWPVENYLVSHGAARIVHPGYTRLPSAPSAEIWRALFLPDGDKSLVSAANFDPKTATMRGVLILELDAEGAMLCSVRADRATWSPTPGGATKGRWLLERFGVEYPDPQRRAESKTGPAVFLTGMYASELSPEDVQRRQTESWVRSLSLAQLKALQDDLMQRSREPGASASALLEVVRTKHERIAAPLVSLVMLMLGLPFFLDRTPGNILGAALRCMIATGLCYTLAFVAKSINPGTVSPLPFWLPVFVFAPIATVLITRIRT